MTLHVAAHNISGSAAPAIQLELRAGERWYVAMTLSRKERVAVANLGNQNFRTFVPLQQVMRRHARRYRNELVPAFPGYVFIVLDTAMHRWRSVDGTLGVARLLRDGDGPLAVAPEIVETLVRSSNSRGVLVFEPPLAAGDKVRLISGPFAESLGVLQRLDGEDRVQLLLQLLGGPVKVTVPRDYVTAAR